MWTISHEEVNEFVSSSLTIAYKAAHDLILNESRVKAARAVMMANQPRFMRLKQAHGTAGWGAVLAVDLRESSKRARRIGTRDTYATMQTFIATMGFLVEKAGGSIIGLRGDGIFAAFGFRENPDLPDEEDMKAAVYDAASCGRAMLQAVDEHINLWLTEFNIEAGLRIGVVIDVDELVITRIGFKDAEEVTAYADAVNDAWKVRAPHCVVLTPRADMLYPRHEQGRVTTKAFGDNLQLVFPADLAPMIERPQQWSVLK